MLCPSCQNRLAQETLEEQSVNRCAHCQGTWFDESKLGPVVGAIDIGRIDKSAKTFSRSELRQGPTGLNCPRCAAAMTLFNYAHDSDVLVNRCPKKCGNWLAMGQLELLAQYRADTSGEPSLGRTFVADKPAAPWLQVVCNLIRSRMLAFVVAIVSLVIALLTTDAGRIIDMIECIPLGLACIWFCDALGKFTGIRITHTTPGIFVAIGGWLLLLAPVFVALLGPLLV